MIRFATGAIGAIGRDLDGIERTVATVDVVRTRVNVAFYRCVYFLHNYPLYPIMSKVVRFTVDIAGKM